MQLYALDHQKSYVNATWAMPGQSYSCPECGDFLRVRGGSRMQRHFYHYRGKSFCRQRAKSGEHLWVQQRLMELLPEGEGRMERHFPEIGRIADVAWEERKVVFEVQCAVMTPEEALARTEDYRALGWLVVWILHDKRYNGRVCSPFEESILLHPHYFTNIDDRGKGTIYDQLVIWKEGRRYAASDALCMMEGLLDLREPLGAVDAPRILLNRISGWSLHCGVDYLGHWQKNKLDAFWKEWATVESRELLLQRWQILRRVFTKLFIRPYRLAFQWILESSCKKG